MKSSSHQTAHAHAETLRIHVNIRIGLQLHTLREHSDNLASAKLRRVDVSKQRHLYVDFRAAAGTNICGQGGESRVRVDDVIRNEIGLGVRRGEWLGIHDEVSYAEKGEASHLKN